MQVLVGFALAGFLSLAVLQLINTGLKGFRTINLKIGNVDTANLVRMGLSKSSICISAFRDASDNIIQLNSASPTAFSSIKNTTQYLFGPSADPLSLSKFQDLDVANNEYIYNLVLPFSNSMVYGSTSQKITIPLYVKLAASGVNAAIVDCNTSGSPSVASGSHCGVYTQGVAWSASIPCQGMIPITGCPAGYTQAGGDYKSPGNRYFVTCVKN